MSGSTRKVVRVLGALTAILLAGGPAALAARLRVAGSGRLPAAALALAPAAPSTVLHVTFTLTPRDPARLAAYARAVSDPSSPLYRRYLTPSQFGRRFGATPAGVRSVRRWLRAHGLTPGMTSPGALSIPVRATTRALERGLGVSMHRLAFRSGRTALATTVAPSAPSGIAAAVNSVVGLDTVTSRHPLFVRGARRVAARRSSPHVATGGPQACAAARSTASAQGAYTADQIASAYGFSGLYGAGDLGAGTTVAVYELESFRSADVGTYASCYGIQPSIGVVAVDGGAATGVGSGEAALDIENLLGLAPRVNVLVYEGPNSNSGSPGAGPYDTFSAIINQDRARVVSVSWGECEAALGATDAGAESSLFQQAAIEGQTFVAAAGDNGSEDCASATIPNTSLAVDDPASQPFVLGVGGTTLSALGPRPTESVWNDGGHLGASPLQPGAGGGGISDLWPMPTGQRTAAAGLGVLAAGTTGSQCGNPGGYCRQVPDVAADANPATGYVIYWNGDGSAPGQSRGWQAIGGTSGGAPVWAALIALADASRACAGAPIGDAIPALYRAASDSYANDFNDIRSGNNDFTGTSGGRFAAGAGYDEASGLGTPNAAALASGLCAHTIHLRGPASERSAARATVTVPLHAEDAPGAALSYSARGLPSGLALAASTGLISGRPRRPGVYTVTVIARDSFGAVTSNHFVWHVGGAARLSAVALTRSGRHAPVLSLTVSAGSGSPGLRRLTIGLPASLRLVSTRGLRVMSGAARALIGAQLSGGTLTLVGRRSYRSLRLTLAAPGLRTAAAPGARRQRPRAVAVQVTDTGQGISQLRARPR